MCTMDHPTTHLTAPGHADSACQFFSVIKMTKMTLTEKQQKRVSVSVASCGAREIRLKREGATEVVVVWSLV